MVNGLFELTRTREEEVIQRLLELIRADVPTREIAARIEEDLYTSAVLCKREESVPIFNFAPVTPDGDYQTKTPNCSLSHASRPVLQAAQFGKGNRSVNSFPSHTTVVFKLTVFFGRTNITLRFYLFRACPLQFQRIHPQVKNTVWKH